MDASPSSDSPAVTADAPPEPPELGADSAPPGAKIPMPTADFDELVAAMAAESFDSHRIKLLRKIAPNRWFTVEQLTEFLKTMDFDSPGRTEVAAIVYPRLVNRDQFTLIFLHLTHSSNKRLLEERMAQVPEYTQATAEPVPLDNPIPETERAPAPSPVAPDSLDTTPPPTEPALKEEDLWDEPTPVGPIKGLDPPEDLTPALLQPQAAEPESAPAAPLPKAEPKPPPAASIPEPEPVRDAPPERQPVRVASPPRTTGGLWSLRTVPWIVAGAGIVMLSMALGYFAQREISARTSTTPVPTATVAAASPTPTPAATATAAPTATPARTVVAMQTPRPTRQPLTPEQKQRRLAARHAASGRAHHKAGRLADARKELDEAIRLDGKNARFHAWIALVHYDRDDLAAAESSARRAVSINSREPWAHLALGNVHQAKGRNAAAVTEYNAFLKLQPTGPVAREVRAVVQMLEGSP